MAMILFRNRRGRFGFLSNFWPAPFEARGHAWPTVEHFFQAMKTTDQRCWGMFASLSTPLEAKKLGRQVSLRGDWEAGKVAVMLEALR